MWTRWVYWRCAAVTAALTAAPAARLMHSAAALGVVEPVEAVICPMGLGPAAADELPSAVAGTGVLAATVGECVAAEQPDRTAPGRKTRSSPGGMAAHRGQVVRGMSAPSRADPAAGDGPILA